MLREYVSKRRQPQIEYSLFDSIPIQFINPFVFDISIPQVVAKLEGLMSRNYFQFIEVIYIGQFGLLEDKDVEALYSDGCIYLSNVIDSNDNVLEHLIHESLHSIESNLSQDIYFDKQLEHEFLGKRKNLMVELDSNGFSYDENKFMNPEFDMDFDKYLYQEIGYTNLSMLSASIFINPYAITDISEYLATGWTEYFLGNVNDIRNMCPVLYKKINEIRKELDGK